MKKRISSFLFIFCIVFVSVQVIPSAETTLQNTQRARDLLRSRQIEISYAKEKLMNELDKIAETKEEAMERKNLLDQDISLTREEISNSEKIIAGYEAEILTREGIIAQNEATYASRFELLKKRVRSMYEEGEISYLSIIFTAESLTDMLTRSEYISSVIENDRNTLNRLIVAKNVIINEKAQLEKNIAEAEFEKLNLELKRADLDEKLEQVMNEILLIQELTNVSIETYTRLEQEEIAANDEIIRLGEEIAKLQRYDYVGGNFAWPVPSSKIITSSFGYRADPFHHNESFHNGLDIGANLGSPIIAANDGVVVIATYGNVYGNYVLINHGGNIQTQFP